jgi:hypothetical protein
MTNVKMKGFSKLLYQRFSFGAHYWGKPEYHEGLLYMKCGNNKGRNGKVFILYLFLFAQAIAVSAVVTASQSLPDLYIDDVRMIQEQNGRFLKISIGNNGPVFPEEKVDVEFIARHIPRDGGKIILQQSIVIPYDKLAPASLYDVELKEGIPAEAFILNIKIDPRNKINESNKKNNISSKVFPSMETKSLPADKQCNLAIGKFYVVPYYGNKVLLRIHILNLGNLAPDHNFLVSLSWEPSVSGDKNSWSLKAKNHQPGSEVIISSGYITLPNSGMITFKAVIDPDGKIKESNKQDNQKTLVYSISH